MHTFCTLTSKYHISFTLALISKISHPICILTLDKFSYFFFKKKENKKLLVFSIDDLKYKNIKKLSKDRNRIEYIFTLKPIFIFYLLKNHIKKNEFIIYLDSDIFFLKNSSFLTKKIKKHSIYLTKHNFSNFSKPNIIYGKFNAGFISFKSDYFGKKYAYWWKNKCIKSCKFDVTNKNKIFTDQGYLDFFERLSKKNIKILDSSVYNLAPWNIDNYKITQKNKTFYSNRKIIIFYHFQYFRIFLRVFCLPGLYIYKIKKNKTINNLYKLYFNNIKQHIITNKLEFPELNKSVFVHFLRSILKKDFKIYF